MVKMMHPLNEDEQRVLNQTQVLSGNKKVFDRLDIESAGRTFPGDTHGMIIPAQYNMNARNKIYLDPKISMLPFRFRANEEVKRDPAQAYTTPETVLLHELGHALDYWSGRGSGGERWQYR